MATFIVIKTTQITEQFKIDADSPKEARDAIEGDETKGASTGQTTKTIRLDVRTPTSTNAPAAAASAAGARVGAHRAR